LGQHLSMLKIRTLSREEIIANDPLGDFFVWWDDITIEDILSLKKKLEISSNELEMQKFFENNPIFLIQHLGGGHGRWVIPHKKLGSEYITDFLIGEKHSGGFVWIAVELESPKVKLFNKYGDPSKPLNHAIRQILDWRAWLQENQNYAARSRNKNGLGLTDIEPRLEGLILIGREKDLKDNNKELRRQLTNDLRIKIHTYDWLIRTASSRNEALKSSRQKG